MLRPFGALVALYIYLSIAEVSSVVDFLNVRVRQHQNELKRQHDHRHHHRHHQKPTPLALKQIAPTPDPRDYQYYVNVRHQRDKIAEDSFSFSKIAANFDDPHQRRSEEWNYDHGSDKGPLSWHRTYPHCKGPHQSPVNIELDKKQQRSNGRFCANDLEAGVGLVLRHYDMPIYGKIQNTGNVLRMQPNNNYVRMQASFLQDDTQAVEYFLEEVQFHWGNSSSGGSEHSFSGRRSAMELQFYHTPDPNEQRKRGDLPLVVFAVLFDIADRDNEQLDALIKHLPHLTTANSVKDVKPPIVLKQLLPVASLRSFFLYRGSLPHPPCTPNTVWIVFKETLEVSQRQLASFRSLYEGTPQLKNNFRPTQSLSGRRVYKSCLEEADQQRTVQSTTASSKEERLHDQPQAPLTNLSGGGKASAPKGRDTSYQQAPRGQDGAAKDKSTANRGSVATADRSGARNINSSNYRAFAILLLCIARFM